MKRVFVIIALAAVFVLAFVNDKSHPRDKMNVGNDTVIWLGKGLNWDYQIKLIHKPNDQVLFIGHGKGGVKPCEALDYAVEVSEGLIYKGHKGNKFTSFKAVYEGSPAFLNPVSTMSYADPKGLDNGKPYGMEHNACFTKPQWEQLQEDQSNTVKVTVTAFPYDNSSETITLRTANVPANIKP